MFTSHVLPLYLNVTSFLTRQERSLCFILTSYPSLIGMREGSHAITIMSISSLPRWKHPRAPRCAANAGGRREKPEERKRKDFGTVFPCRHNVTYWTYRFATRRFWQGATARLISKNEPNPSATASSLIESKARVGKPAGCARGADIFPLVIIAMFFHALSFSLSLSLFISVPNRTSSVFILRFSLSLFLSFGYLASLPFSLSLCLFLSFHYLLYHFSQLSFSRSFRYLTSCQLSP